MKKVLLLWLGFLVMLHAEEKIAGKAASGKFYITQEFKVDEFVEKLRFKDAEQVPLSLVSYPWPGIYAIAPDEKWILRTQKTGSGDSIAILYHMEENGRLSEVVDFNALLWKASDAAARLKQRELFHTGIEDSSWSKDHASLLITLGGSNTDKSGDVIKTQLTYDLLQRKITRTKSAE